MIVGQFSLAGQGARQLTMVGAILALYCQSISGHRFVATLSTLGRQTIMSRVASGPVASNIGISDVRFHHFKLVLVSFRLVSTGKIFFGSTMFLLTLLTTPSVQIHVTLVCNSGRDYEYGFTFTKLIKLH